MDINLNKIISKTFLEIAYKIINCDIMKAILKGGRNTTKSAVAAICLVVGCMINNASAVAIVKHNNKVERRLASQFRWAISILGVGAYWKEKVGNQEFVLLDSDGKETMNSIRMTGCDDPENLKSYRARLGTFRYVWIEELTNFKNAREVNNLINTMARGGMCCVIHTFNPPERTSNWVNEKYNAPEGTVLNKSSNCIYEEVEFTFESTETNEARTVKLIQAIHHSTYLDIIRDGNAHWLGDLLLAEAKLMEIENNDRYRNEWLGEVIGTNANIFRNVKEWDGDTTGLSLSPLFRGWDWGLGGPDTCAYTTWFYDKKNKRAYLMLEFGSPKMEVDTIAYEMKKVNPHNFPIKADSSVPILNNQLINKGITIVKAKKGPDSVRAGIEFFRNLNGIYINKIATTQSFKEFKNYEYVIDKDGTITTQLPDKNNHFIDCSRYAFEDEIRYNVA